MILFTFWPLLENENLSPMVPFLIAGHNLSLISIKPIRLTTLEIEVAIGIHTTSITHIKSTYTLLCMYLYVIVVLQWL